MSMEIETQDQTTEADVTAAKALVAASREIRIRRAQDELRSLLEKHDATLLAEPFFEHTPGGSFAVRCRVFLKID